MRKGRRMSRGSALRQLFMNSRETHDSAPAPDRSGAEGVGEPRNVCPAGRGGFFFAGEH